MGQTVGARTFSREDRQRYREKVARCLDVLARMLAADRRTPGAFSSGRDRMGLEMELNLVDSELHPAMANASVLERIADPTFQTELGQYNIEANVDPRPLGGDNLLDLERELRSALDAAEEKAHQSGAAIIMIGMLPTLTGEHFDLRWLSKNPRYALLNEQIFASRQEDLTLDIEGPSIDGAPPEHLSTAANSVLPEAACTSIQLHVQVPPAEFASTWNAAQSLAGAQVALAANSPFLLDHALWAETRIPLFLQATDTRPPELSNQGVRPRVWFGERWITSIFDLFEENVRYFPALLPQTDDEDPMATLEAGGVPALSELLLHNGTIWRWNRPVYDVTGGEPHLRVENRVLPAGPTVIDVLANAAFFYGAVRALVEQDRPVWTQMSFQAAQENFFTAAKDGMDGELYWPGVGPVSPSELVLRRLLPLAHAGLRSHGVSDEARERYLGVIEQRCITRRNGAWWQRETVRLLTEKGGDRPTALLGMLARYREHMHSNQPVHTWPVG